jgi:hypothetical protein
MQWEINIEDLSRNFKDAILIARGLKIRYLWIDALCIIQDSAEDWNQEAVHMAKYYRNASVMISALTSPGANQGILHSRLSDKQAVQLSTTQGAVLVRPILDDIVSITRWSGHASISDSRPQLEDLPLFERGWTLQERVMSRQIVHYSKQEMIRQCKTCLISEDGQYSTDEKTRTESRLVDLVDLDSKMTGPTTSRLKWYSVVTEFTRRSLTYDDDKLPALSGLAGEVARVTGDTYLAGLWKKRIRDELLWETFHSGDGPAPNTARIESGTPTWSWASIRGEITNNIIESRRVPREYDVRFLKVVVRPATSDPFGRVSMGSIVICHVPLLYRPKNVLQEKKSAHFRREHNRVR